MKMRRVLTGLILAATMVGIAVAVHTTQNSEIDNSVTLQYTNPAIAKYGKVVRLPSAAQQPRMEARSSWMLRKVVTWTS